MAAGGCSNTNKEEVMTSVNDAFQLNLRLPVLFFQTEDNTKNRQLERGGREVGRSNKLTGADRERHTHTQHFSTRRRVVVKP